MNVANLENCKKLFELSSWDETQDVYYDASRNIDGIRPILRTTPSRLRTRVICPAYDLGYLLRKLPSLSIHKDDEMLPYYASYYGQRFDAETPENAVAKLAIELFKQGILQKEVE